MGNRLKTARTDFRVAKNARPLPKAMGHKEVKSAEADHKSGTVVSGTSHAAKDEITRRTIHETAAIPDPDSTVDVSPFGQAR